MTCLSSLGRPTTRVKRQNALFSSLVIRSLSAQTWRLQAHSLPASSRLSIPPHKRPPSRHLPFTTTSCRSESSPMPPPIVPKGTARTNTQTISQPPTNRPRQLVYLLLIATVGICAATYLSSSKEIPEDRRILNPVKFVPYTIIDKTPASPTSFILTIRPEHGVDPSQLRYLAHDISSSSHGDRSKPGQDTSDRNLWSLTLWSVEVKQPQIQILREYTPLPPTSREEAEAGILRFLIRVDGEVSRYLSHQPIGGRVEIRGPFPTLAFTRPPGREANDEVVFIAGGTSIATALQAIYAFSAPSDPSVVSNAVSPAKKSSSSQRNHTTNAGKIHLLWAVRSRADLQSPSAHPYSLSHTPSSWSSYFSRSPPPRLLQNLSLADENDRLLDATTSTGKNDTQIIESPSPIVQQLRHWKSVLGERLSIRIAVTSEGLSITEADLRQVLGVPIRANPSPPSNTANSATSSGSSSSSMARKIDDASLRRRRLVQWAPIDAMDGNLGYEHQPKLVEPLVSADGTLSTSMKPAPPPNPEDGNPPSAYRLVFVSGPEKFVEHYTGPALLDISPAYRRVREGGMLAKLERDYSHVWNCAWQVVNLD